jgi:hypothetical protein
VIFKPFRQQSEFLRSKARVRLLLCAKRGGKSEAAYVDTIMRAEARPGYKNVGKDPYLIGLIAPTENMLRRLVWPKFRHFARPFEKEFNKSDNTLTWSNGTQILGFTAEKINRMEGFKLSHVHMTEAFQMTEHVFLESLARLSDTQGTIVIDGSLGPNLPNPKAHWIYKTFKEKDWPDCQIWEWATASNPHFPQEELEQLRDALDPRTYRQMFEIDWNTSGTALVYDTFDESNVTRGYRYDPNLETSVSIDWGWANDMACLFIQYDPKSGCVYVFDEIIGSRITLESLWSRIVAKGYRISNWFCDIAGTQEREQTGRSNVQWFKQSPRNVNFRYRSTAVNYGIPIVRQYICNGLGQRKLFIDEVRCPKLLDGMRNYSYPEKNGVIQNENPIKDNDHGADSLRYYFINRLDPNKAKDSIAELNRWKLT